MKRSLITDKGIISFTGGATTKGAITLPKITPSKEQEIYRECITRANMVHFFVHSNLLIYKGKLSCYQKTFNVY